MAAAFPFIAAGMSAIGSISSAQGQARNYDRQAQAEEYNALAKQQESSQALQASNANEEAKRRDSARRIGSQKASLIESGIDITSGTGADLVYQSGLNSELDALNIRYQGTLQSHKSQAESALDTYQAQSARTNAKNARGPAMLLTAATNALSSYSAYSGKAPSSAIKAKVPVSSGWD